MKLTQTQFLSLIDWLRKNKEQIVNDRPQLKRLAIQIKNETGIVVSNQTISRYAKTAGIEWHPRASKKSRVNNQARSERRAIATKSDLIANTLLLLCKDLGFKIPDEVRSILEAPSRTAFVDDLKQEQVAG